MPIATTWMDHEGIMLSEICQTEKEKYTTILLIYGLLKKRKTHRKKRPDLWLPEVGVGGEGIG